MQVIIGKTAAIRSYVEHSRLRGQFTNGQGGRNRRIRSVPSAFPHDTLASEVRKLARDCCRKAKFSAEFYLPVIPLPSGRMVSMQPSSMERLTAGLPDSLTRRKQGWVNVRLPISSDVLEVDKQLERLQRAYKAEKADSLGERIATGLETANAEYTRLYQQQEQQDQRDHVWDKEILTAYAEQMSWLELEKKILSIRNGTAK